jgi:hypothetical protein
MHLKRCIIKILAFKKTVLAKFEVMNTAPEHVFRKIIRRKCWMWRGVDFLVNITFSQTITAKINRKQWKYNYWTFFILTVLHTVKFKLMDLFYCVATRYGMYPPGGHFCDDAIACWPTIKYPTLLSDNNNSI